MTIFDFVTQAELDDLPEDNHVAFATFIRHALRRLSEATDPIDGSEQEGWRIIEEWRYDFMNVAIAAAKQFEIEPFSTMHVPGVGNFDDTAHRQFKADLDFFMTQLAIDNTIRDRRDSVLLPPASKDRIRNHVHQLKKCIDGAELTDARREALLKKLADFESELEKRRLSLLALSRITLEVMMIPGGLWASQQITTKLINNVLQAVAEAKVVDDENRKLPPIEPPKKLLSPRPLTDEKKRPIPAAFDTDLDDDVPF